MKIRSRILLFAIEISINFLEINTSSGASGEGSFRPRRIPTKAPSRGRKTFSFRYLDTIINMKVKIDDNGVYRLGSCEAEGDERAGVPTMEYRLTHNFITKALIKKPFAQYTGPLLRCVIYIDEDEHGVQRVLGAKIPPAKAHFRQMKKDHPRVLDPDDTKWYITYDRIDFVVKQHPWEIEPESLYRTQGNLVPTEEYKLIHKVTPYYIMYGGIEFIYYRKGTDGVIVGAHLARLVNPTPGYTET